MLMSSPGRVQDHVHPEQHEREGERAQRLKWEAMVRDVEVTVGVACDLGHVRRAVIDLFRRANVERCGAVLGAAVVGACIRRGPRSALGLAGFVGAVNSRFPEVGLVVLEAMVERLGVAWRHAEIRVLGSLGALAAHLVNQGVAHEVLVLELVALLLCAPVDAERVDVGVAVVVKCGRVLSRVAPRALQEVFDRLREVLVEGPGMGVPGSVIGRVDEAMRARRDGWGRHPAVPRALAGLVRDGEQIMHEVGLEEEVVGEGRGRQGEGGAWDPAGARAFRFDPEFEESEARYAVLRTRILRDLGAPPLEEADAGDARPKDGIGPATGAGVAAGMNYGGKGEKEEGGKEGEEKEGGGKEGGGKESDGGNDGGEVERQVHLTIMSSLDARETAHKLLALRVGRGREEEVARCVVARCAKERTYSKHFGLLVDELCTSAKGAPRKYAGGFAAALRAQYAAADALPVNEIRNVGRLAAHVLASGSVEWGAVLQAVTLTEEGTTPNGRIFLKIMFQEAADQMGPARLAEIGAADGVRGTETVFRRTNLREARFCINFFYSIRLPLLAAPLETWIVQEAERVEAKLAARGSGSDSSSGSSGSSDSESESESDSESDSESREGEDGPVSRKRKIDDAREGEQDTHEPRAAALRTRYDSSDSDAD